MNEEKKLYILLIVLGALIALVIGINFANEHKNKRYLESFNSAMESGEKKLILLGRKTCGYCQMFQPLLDYMKETYEFDYLYIDTEKLTEKGLNEILEKLNIDPEDFGTPHTSLIEGGKVVDEIGGYVDEQKLLQFLIKNGYAPENSKTGLNYVDYSQYKELIKTDKSEILVIGQTSCSACMMAKPALLSIANKYNVKINYFNLSELQASENASDLIKEFTSSLTFLSEEEWGTPLMIVVKDKKVIANSNGYYSEQKYTSFLKEQGFIGE